VSVEAAGMRQGQDSAEGETKGETGVSVEAAGMRQGQGSAEGSLKFFRNSSKDEWSGQKHKVDGGKDWRGGRQRGQMVAGGRNQAR
jgi:hypothetical protein